MSVPVSVVDEPEQDEMVKRGMSVSRDVTLTVDPSRVGTPYAAGTEILQPGAEVPVHRQLDRDQTLVMLKGQGRMVLNEQILNVTPGKMVFVPRGTWYGLRNTGTGRLQLAWISSPPGLEVFFRELSQLDAAPAPEAVQELAQRHGIEMRPPSEGASTDAPPLSRSSRGGRRRRRNRGERGSAAGRASGSPSGQAASASSPPAAHAEQRTASAEPSGGSSSSRSRSRRRRRGSTQRSGAATPGHQAQAGRSGSGPQRPVQQSGRSGSGPQRPAQQSGRSGSGPQRPPQQSGRSGSGKPPSSASRSSPSSSARPRASRGGYRSRVKEVYQDGKWVKIEGGKPFIATGGKDKSSD